MAGDGCGVPVERGSPLTPLKFNKGDTQLRTCVTTTLAATCRSRVVPYVCAATVISLLLTLSIATAEPKRVLLVHFGRDFAPWNEYVKGFRAELDRQWPEPVDLYETSLAIARFQTRSQEGPFIDYLGALFDDHRPDLIVALGAPAVSFFQQHRQQLFTSTPMLL